MRYYYRRSCSQRRRGGCSLLAAFVTLCTISICYLSKISPVSGFAIDPQNNANLAIQSKYDARDFGAFIPEILYESDRILAINKPTEISHHDDGETGELGIVSRVREYYNQNNTLPSSSSPDSRLWGVHRLDKVTSGILLFAKDREMASILSQKFKENEMTKYYVGISNHKPQKQKQGWVKGNMIRGRRKSWYLTREKRDNYAITRFFSAGLGHLYHAKLVRWDHLEDSRAGYDPKTCLLFRPHTGKTHQIRVAAKSAGLTLLGDPIYGGVAGLYPRAFLHATAIHLPLEGVDHDPVTIFCPPVFAPLLWEEDAGKLFDGVVCNLFQKHCECPEILELVEQSSLCANTSNEDDGESL